MKLVLISAGGANFASIINGFARLGVNAVLSDNIDEIQGADRVILPGVGSAGFAMNAIMQKGLGAVIPALKQPVLGICLGQQLLCSESAEDNNTKCLGIFPNRVVKLTNAPIIPQMGWNNCPKIDATNPLMRHITPNDDFYFVHSFAVEPNNTNSIAICEYGVEFAAAINHKNFYGVQYHPEKSGRVGQILLQNFLEI